MALFFTLLVGLFIVLGVIIGYFKKHSDKFNALSIGLAFGVITSLIILELLPESYELLDKQIGLMIVFILLGIIILKLLDIFVPHHEHEHKHHHTHCKPSCHTDHLNHIGIVSSIALILHNLIEGMTLYITTTTSIETGLLLCLGIGLHNLPLGFMLSSTLENKKEIVITTTLVSLSTFVGGLVMLIISDYISDLLVGLLITITLGMLIYISCFELLPQIINTKNKKYSLCGIVCGIVILLISVMLG